MRSNTVLSGRYVKLMF